MKRTRVPAVAAAIAAAALVVSGCSGMSTRPDEIGLVYNAGPISSTEFDICVPPSNREWDGPSDEHFAYPFGQRTFDFSGAEGADSAAITVVSADNVTMTVKGVATFALNSQCEVLREFHERIGLKFSAWMEDGQTTSGWSQMLNIYLKQPLDKAMDAVSKEHEYKELYSDPAVKEQWEEKVGDLVTRFVADQAGGSFFCQPSYAGTGECGDLALTIQAPTPPENIQEALTAEQQAVAENNAQKERNETARTRYDSFADCKEILSEENCVLLHGIDSGKVTVIPVPSGAGINVTPK